MESEFPISITVTNLAEPFQLKFSEEAAVHIVTEAGLLVHTGSEGLVICSVDERSLDSAVHKLKQLYPQLVISNPKVNYIEKDEMLVPYGNINVITPEDYLGDVMGDLTRRRACIRGVEENQNGKEILAELPIAELFSYETALRSMTNGQASFNVTFSRYQPVSTNGKPGGDVA